MLLQKSQGNLRLVYDYLVKWREVGEFSWKKAGNIHIVFIHSQHLDMQRALHTLPLISHPNNHATRQSR